LVTEPPHSCFGSSFQFETEAEGGKLRRDVLAEGNVGSGGTPVGITSILSGQEEMFTFQRAVSIYHFRILVVQQKLQNHLYKITLKWFPVVFLFPHCKY
jgi:hypothetical protein